MTPHASLLLLIALGAPVGASAEPTPSVAAIVRSKEWKVVRTPNKEEEFIGDVRYKAGPTMLTADWALFKHEPQTWQAKGHVGLEHRLRSGDLVQGFGQRADYDQKTQKGSLTNGDALLRFKRTPPAGEPDLGEGRRLDWQGRERVSLDGEVHLWGPRLEAWAQRAVREGTLLTLSGDRPVLHLLQGDWTGAVKADTITAVERPETISADGKTQGWLQFHDDIRKLAR
ncbi:MAG: hypothetical protein AAB320_01970 [Elusimicrobiota bacterium]